MAIAFVQEISGDPGDRSTEGYDAVAAKLNVDADPPAGLIVHTAGFTSTGTFRIFDVWETKEDWERFRAQRLDPALQEVMGDMPEGGPTVSEDTYDLHDVTRG